MRIGKLGFKILVLIFLGCLFAPGAHGEMNFASRSFNQPNSENIFQLADVQKAILKLCRNLQIDPKNKTAQQHFALIASHPGLTARQRSQVFLLEDLLKFNKDLKRRADYLISKRDTLKSQLITNGYGDQEFLDSLSDIERYVYEITSSMDAYYDQALFDQSDPLMVMYRILNDERGQQLARVEYLQEQYRWLKVIGEDQKQYLSPQRIVQTSNIVTPTVAGNIISVEPGLAREPANEQVYDNFGRIAIGSAKEENYGDWKNEEGDSRAQLRDLKEDLKKKEQKINDLSRQVVDLSLKMSEIEILLNKKVESTEHLKDELIDTDQRFMLGKRIIQEKDAEIQSLRSALDHLKTGSETSGYVPPSRDKKLIELSGILEIYKYKLSEKDRLVKEKTMALAKAQDDLNFLKGQLSALELDLSELKKNSGNKEFQSPGIENKIRELQSKFEEIQFFLLENLGDSDKMKTHQRLESSNLSK